MKRGRKKIEMIGKKFNHLTVIEECGKYKNKILYKCECDCLNKTIVIVQGVNLRGNHTKSCGCLQKEVAKERGDVFIGKCFGYLTVLDNLPSRNGSRYCLVRCKCGKEKSVNANNMKYGKIISCGCVGLERRILGSIKHGQSYNKLYFVWKSMMNRCYNQDFADYHNYGGRGILVSNEWHDLNVFISDMSNGYDKNLQLDRIDNNKNYSKENCKWSTRKENNRNKRNNRVLYYMNQSKTVTEWCEILNLNYSSVIARAKMDISVEKILFGKKYKM
jgi:hypothetical protein